MSYVNRSYDSEVIHEGPYGSYSAEYRIDEYGNRVPHHQLHHHHNGVGGVVSEIVGDITDHHHHHHHHHDRPAEVYERREEHIVDSAYDPYRRIY
ncbi:ADP-ribosylation factor GTPase-activating protein AGD2 [Bienertia sinuspersici]